jgi:YggT family protein
MLSQAGIFLVETFFGLFSLALLLRFLLQAVRAPVRNPLSQFLVALTGFIVTPVRRIVPGLWGIDLTTVVLALLVKSTEIALVLAFRGFSASAPAMALLGVACVAAIALLKLTVYIVLFAVLIYSILTWVSPFSPAMPLFAAVSRPFLLWFRRIPPIGNIDLSPLFLVVACQLTLMLPVQWLEQVATGWLRHALLP